MALFKGKAVEIRMVPATPLEGESEASPRLVEVPPETIEKIAEVSKEIIKDLTKAVVIIFAADTARKVIIELAKK